MRNIPIAAYVATRRGKINTVTSDVVVAVNNRPAVYHCVDAALADERRIILLCQKYDRQIDLITSLSVQTILRFNKYGRLSGSDKANRILDPPFR